MSESKNLLDIEYIHKISDKIRESESEDFVENSLAFLLSFYDLINFSFAYDTPLFRARKTESGKGFTSTSDIYYPPKHLTNIGRLNEKGTPFLYLSLSLDTALTEIGAKDGDIIQASGFMLKNNSLTLGVIGESFRSSRGRASILDKESATIISNFIRKLSIKDRKLALSYLYTDLFFDEILRSKNAKKTNYIHSRILSRNIFNKYPNLDGLLYHSVASLASLNVALPSKKADTSIGLVDTMLLKVIKAYPYGLYDIEFIKKPKNILRNGNIIW
ncbi:RES domain-containing protein [Serratia sarumanii]|uniref:RES domain-containing protein n=1 Tax=Serratia sarumanii TaxID=3020826 RepID=A0ABW8QP80_9GAMM